MATRHQDARELIRQRREAIGWVRRVRSALKAGIGPFEIESQFEEGAYGFALRTSGLSLGTAVAIRMRDRAPRPSGLKSVFDFEGSTSELDAHNREVRRRAAQNVRAPSPPQVFGTPTTVARPRERRPSCASRTRGSRRSAGPRSCSRAGPSSDDPGEPEPEQGPLDDSSAEGER